MKAFKKILSLCLAGIMCVGSIGFADTSDAAAENDAAYTRAHSFLKSLSLLGDTEEKEPVALVTRAEFAAWILNVIGISTEESKKTASEDYLGYTNDPDLDQNGDWKWGAEDGSDGAADNREDTSTPFYDVKSTYPRWAAVRMAAQLGMLRGDGSGFWRPDEAITGYEAVKVLVDACGAKFLTGGEYPTGYLRTAAKLGITRGIEKSLSDAPITYRNLNVAIYNALHSDIYRETSFDSNGNAEFTQIDGENLLSWAQEIVYDEGIVTANSITGLDSDVKANANSVNIGRREYCRADDTTDTDGLLGHNVRIYYSRENDRNMIRYFEYKTEKEIKVDAKDIDGYSGSRLSFWRNGRRTERYIGAKTNIIYNNKRISNYTDDIFDIKKGSMTFIDANNDGADETVIIEDIEIFRIAQFDRDNKLIINSLKSDTNTVYTKHDPKHLDLSEGDVKVYDIKGNMLETENMSNDAVINVQRTLDTQGEPVIRILFASDTVTGTVTRISSGNKKVEINSTEYPTAYAMDMTDIAVGLEGTFYLTPDGELTDFDKENTSLRFAWILRISAEKNTLDPIRSVKLYDISNDGFEVYNFADKIKLNGESLKIENALKRAEMYDSAADSYISQMIKYSLNTAGEVKEILTPNAIPHEFYCDTTSQYATWRSSSRMFVNSKPVVYARTYNPLYVNIPKTDMTNEDSYFKKTVEDNTSYSIDGYCKNDVDSAFAEVVFLRTDSTSTGVVSTAQNSAIVKGTERSIQEDDIAYTVTAIDRNGERERMCFDSDLYDKLDDLEAGDLVRWDFGGKKWSIIRVEKFFDVGNMSLMSTDNPYSSAGGANILAPVFYMHGRVISKADNGQFITVSPFAYSRAADGTIARGDIKNTEKDNLVISAKDYNCYKYNKERAQIEAIPYSYILDDETAGNGSEVVVIARWSNPGILIVYN